MIALDASVLIALLDAGDAHHEDAVRVLSARVATGLKLPDCCVLLAADDAGFRTIATFDAQLARVAAERGLDVLAGSV